MVRSEAAMVNTYMFSNMAPKHDAFNRINGGIWQHLEARVQAWARAKRTIYVIAGSIFDGNADGLRDADTEASLLANKTGARVAIPTHFFKIVFHARQNETIDSLAFVLEHVDQRVQSGKRDEWLEDSLTSIDEIETYPGVTFLPELAHSHPEPGTGGGAKVKRILLVLADRLTRAQGCRYALEFKTCLPVQSPLFGFRWIFANDHTPFAASVRRAVRHRRVSWPSTAPVSASSRRRSRQRPPQLASQRVQCVGRSFRSP